MSISKAQTERMMMVHLLVIGVEITAMKLLKY
jgi:hypothetical protein